MKKLIFASILLITAALFTACGGGAGNPGADDDGSNGSNNSSSSSSSKKRTLPTTTTNPYKDFNFELFPSTDCDIDITDQNSGTFKYTVPAGSWKYSEINAFTSNSTGYTYYEFTKDAEGNIVATKYVYIWHRKVTDKEIEKMETRADWEYERDWLPDTSKTSSTGYYLNDHDWVRIYVYEGAANINQEYLLFPKIMQLFLT
ncbi:MAG: hypothetical protein IK102_02760 [Treponema sp.]|nr:hypothetical protein [Treponema sp.]